MKKTSDDLNYSRIIVRIENLKADSKAHWGKMNVAQMLEHCEKPILVSQGKLPVRRSFIGFLFGKMAKKSLLNNHHFKKNLPTDSNFVIKNEADFEKSKMNLIDLIKGLENGQMSFHNENHPFFGKMSKEEWHILTTKHLDHHLRQFGV